MGGHFLQIPGPTNSPGEVLRAISAPTIDHRSAEFQELGLRVLEAIKPVFGTKNPVIIFASSGTGAWEAALVNVLSPGDRILAFETGHFSGLWQKMATDLGLVVDYVPGDWRRAIDPQLVREKLDADTAHKIKAVCCVHNETSTGVTSQIGEIREQLDAANHPALLLVDTISSLASIDYRHDEWKVDVTVAGSQKGLMLPPGLGFNAISDKALAASESARLPKSYWDWKPILQANANGFWPYTPATNLLYGLDVALKMLEDEGLPQVFARHERYGRATRAAVQAWGLEVFCLDERAYSNTLTAVLLPEKYNADKLRAIILDRFDMALGAGLSKLSGRVFRVGHLGSLEDLTLVGALGGVQMGLNLMGVPIKQDGILAALEVLERG